MSAGGPKRKHLMLRRIAGLSLSSVYRQILGLFSAYIKPLFLSPEMYGLWSLIKMVLNYANFTDLGSHAILRYRVPYHLSRGEKEKSDTVRGTVFHAVKYIKLGIAAAVAVAAVAGPFDMVVRVGLGVMVLLILGEWYFDYHMSILKGLQLFETVTAVFFIRPTVTFLTGLVLMYLFGIYGLYASALISLAALVVFLRRVSPIEIQNCLEKPLMREVVARGLPFMAYSFSVVLVNTSDRIIVASALGKESLGYYAIAFMVLRAVRNIPAASRQVIEPAMMERIGRDGGEGVVEPYFFRPLRSAAFLTALLVGGLYTVIPLVIELLLPRYTNGIGPTRILLMGSFFLAQTYLTRGLLVAFNWLKGPIAIMAGVLAFNITFSLTFIRMGFGLSGVALATSMSYVVLFLALYEFLRLRLQGSRALWGRELLVSMIPFAVLACQLWAMGLLPLPESFGSLARTAAQTFFFLAVQAIVLLSAWRAGLFGERETRD